MRLHTQIHANTHACTNHIYGISGSLGNRLLPRSVLLSHPVNSSNYTTVYANCNQHAMVGLSTILIKTYADDPPPKSFSALTAIAVAFLARPY